MINGELLGILESNYMNLSGLNKIFDTLGEALGVFDFSFFISGFTTFSFLMVEVHHHIPDIFHKLTGWEEMAAVILVIYICGLMSWVIGKRIRWGVLCVIHWNWHGVREDLKKVMNETERELGRTNTSNHVETRYTQMWVALSKKEEGKERTAFVNQMWVKRALFEGLITSWLVGLVVSCDFECYQTLLKLEQDSCLPCILKVTMIVFALVSAYMGTEYARNQIKEVVVAHKEICG